MKRKKSVSYAKYGYIFSIPFAAVFLIFSLYPILYTALLGFTDFKGLGAKTWHILDNPFHNFTLILNNGSFRQSLYNTFVIWTANFIPQILLALVLTAWFTSRRNKLRGKGLFKVIFYLPNIITAASIAILFYSLFGYPVGPVNSLLLKLGIVDEPVYFLISKSTSRAIVSFIQFWMWYGYTMIILVSGVLGISPDIYEAAEIDGTTGLQAFLYITLPNLKTILLYVLITSLIGGLNMYDIPKMFMQGGPDNATLTTSVFIYNQAFSGSYLYNRAAAASMIMFLIIAFFSAILFYLLRDKDEIERRKLNRKMRKEYKKSQEARG
ncbi:carbohydrate ABC transporter permease [Fusibacter ferrireducens]|uniref:Sugar ABC transporter permease n=1 Tax=Fusibacter ferrireducens TaxID=2785058 RepID=A0ABR9ZPF1_9FIRM|nr:sugar ABC transporter permease [Fusibacter ferrireducens]MBF4692342.1 sugar ABC transporter permease [Fusibacter ferrireducens]